ncbi:MAG: DNA primase, partial [Bacteroidetes bacterium]
MKKNWSDTKLQELWHLQSAAVFAEAHKDVLQDLPEFRLGKYLWRFGADGVIESAQPIESYEQFWEEVPKTNRDGEVVSIQYHFKYERCFRFLQNRGFYQYIKPDGNFELIRIQHPYIEVIPRYEFVRNFVKDFAREVCNEEVLEMLHRGGTQFLGPERLSNLKFYQPQFLEPKRNRQYLYFKDYYWEVTADSIKQNEYSAINHQIWKDEVKTTPVTKTTKLIEVKETDTGGFDYTITSVGKQCDFLQFLENASNFTWRKERNGATITNDPNLTSEKYIQQKEVDENKHHLISKLCAIGYLALTAKDANVTRAVIAMDGRPGEVGESNGRSGKSLVGELFRHISTIAYINGKQDLKKDQFLWNDVVEKTKLVFLDDVFVNFDFEMLFANISGSWNVNYKGGGRATFDFPKSPKIYLATNHALNGEGASFRDRQWK